MDARQPSFHYSILCEEIYEIAHERTQTFVATHPEATPEEIEEAIRVIADESTPAASSTRLLLELAMQGEEVMRRSLPNFFLTGCNCGCPGPTLGVLLREMYLIELRVDLLDAAGLLDDFLDDDENLLRSIELDPKLRQS